MMDIETEAYVIAMYPEVGTTILAQKIVQLVTNYAEGIEEEAYEKGYDEGMEEACRQSTKES